MARKTKVVVEKYKQLKSERNMFDNYWQSLYEFMLPRKATVNTTVVAGEERNLHLFDNTAMHSAQLLTNALHSLLTNPHSQWFELSTGDFRIDSRDDVRVWLKRSSKRIFDVLNNSNFQTEIHENYNDIVIIGTDCLLVEEDEDRVVRFRAKPIEQVYVEEDARGLVSEVYVKFEMTAQKCLELFGEKNLPKRIKDAQKMDSNTKFNILNAVYPEKFEHPLMDTPVTSHYIFIDDEEDIEVDGFESNPYIVSRFYKTAGEKYGRSPGMVALPDARTLNKMDETVLIGAQKTVDPPLQAPDDGFVFPIITRPGGLNFYRSGTQDTIKPIFNDARIDFGFQAMAERRSRIRQAFFVDQLQLQEGPQKTATEVLQRTEESMRLLAPLIARQQQEKLRPLISRVMQIMFRKGLFDDPPEILRGRELDVNYSSLIAKAQRISEGQNILRGLEAMTPFLNIDPDARDLLDGDNAIKVIGNMFSWTPELIRDEKQVAELRQARAEAEQAKAEAEAADSQADRVQKTVGALGG